jgi:hypothetical protein
MSSNSPTVAATHHSFSFSSSSFFIIIFFFSFLFFFFHTRKASYMHLDSPPTRNDVAPDPCTREGPREPRMAVRRTVLRAEAPDVRGGKQPRPADAQDGGQPAVQETRQEARAFLERERAGAKVRRGRARHRVSSLSRQRSL